jgi:hypothetical protein
MGSIMEGLEKEEGSPYGRGLQMQSRSQQGDGEKKSS